MSGRPAEARPQQAFAVRRRLVFQTGAFSARRTHDADFSARFIVCLPVSATWHNSPTHSSRNQVTPRPTRKLRRCEPFRWEIASLKRIRREALRAKFSRISSFKYSRRAEFFASTPAAEELFRQGCRRTENLAQPPQDRKIQ